MSIGFINGRFISVDELVLPIDERGHQFGDGVYEVVRVYNGKPFMLAEHLERLARSLEAVRIVPNYTMEEIEQFIFEGLEKAGLKDADVYLQITRGITVRQHPFPSVPASTTMTIRPAKQIPGSYWEDGVSAILLEDERWANCYIKTLNLLPNILAKQLATEAGCYEGILVRGEYVTEGTSSNLFMVKDGVLMTAPATKQILHGITRLAVLRLAHELEIPVQEVQFTPEELKAADEVFVTSSIAEVMPVVKLDGQTIGHGKPGPLTKKLHQHLRELTGPMAAQV